MPDLHINSTLLAGPAVAADAGGSSAGGAEAFSALLAGTIAAMPAGREPAHDAEPAPGAIALTTAPPGVLPDTHPDTHPDTQPATQPATLTKTPSTAPPTELATLMESDPLLAPLGEPGRGAVRPHADQDGTTDPTTPTPDPTSQFLASLGILPPLDAQRQTAAALKDARLLAATPPSTAGAVAKIPRQTAQAVRETPLAGVAEPGLASATAAVADPAAKATTSGSTLEVANEQGAHADPAASAPSTPLPQQAHSAAAPAIASASPASAAPVQLSVAASVGSPAWREEFTTSVSLLATQRVSSAELHLHPAELGPVQVHIRIESGEATIACAALHADTRAALDAALPRLRELLEANGITVGNASVGTQSSGGDTPGNGASGRQHLIDTHGSAGIAAASDSPSLAVTRPGTRADQLVDVFA